MTEQQMTPWFDALTTKPARDGVYSVKVGDYARYARFSKGEWFRYDMTPEESLLHSKRSTSMYAKRCNPQWRGFAECQDNRKQQLVWVNKKACGLEIWRDN